jgi:RNA polymerase sigma factor (sigma-70 family)
MTAKAMDDADVSLDDESFDGEPLAQELDDLLDQAKDALHSGEKERAYWIARQFIDQLGEESNIGPTLESGTLKVPGFDPVAMAANLPAAFVLEEYDRYRKLMTDQQNIEYVCGLIETQRRNRQPINKDDAEMIFQDVTRKIWNEVRRPNWSQPEKPKAYLKTVVSHTCLDHFRKQQRELTHEQSLPNEETLLEDAESKGDSAQPRIPGRREILTAIVDPGANAGAAAAFGSDKPLTPRVQAAMDTLPEKLRNVVLLRIQHPEETSREIGNRLGISAATVRKRYKRGIDRLKKMLSEVCLSTTNRRVVASPSIRHPTNSIFEISANKRRRAYGNR